MVTTRSAARAGSVGQTEPPIERKTGPASKRKKETVKPAINNPELLHDGGEEIEENEGAVRVPTVATRQENGTRASMGRDREYAREEQGLLKTHLVLKERSRKPVNPAAAWETLLEVAKVHDLVVVDPEGKGNCQLWVALLLVLGQEQGQRTAAAEGFVSHTRAEVTRTGAFTSDCMDRIRAELVETIRENAKGERGEEARQWIDLDIALHKLATTQDYGDNDGNMATALAYFLGYFLAADPDESEFRSEDFRGGMILIGDHAYAVVPRVHLLGARYDNPLVEQARSMYEVAGSKAAGGSLDLVTWRQQNLTEARRSQQASTQEEQPNVVQEETRLAKGTLTIDSSRNEWDGKNALELILNAAGIRDLYDIPKKDLKCFCKRSCDGYRELMRHIAAKHQTSDMETLVAWGVANKECGRCPGCEMICNIKKDGKFHEHKCTTNPQQAPGPLPVNAPANGPAAPRPQAVPEGQVRKIFQRIVASQLQDIVDLDHTKPAHHARAEKMTQLSEKCRAFVSYEGFGYLFENIENRPTYETPARDQARKDGDILRALQRGDNNAADKQYQSNGLAQPSLAAYISKVPMQEQWNAHGFNGFDTPLQITRKEIMEAAQSVDAQASMGPMGDPMREWVAFLSVEKHAELLAQFFNIVHRKGALSSEGWKMLTRVKAVALKKDELGLDFRPIAVAGGLERIRQKVLVNRVNRDIALDPTNMTLAKNGVSIMSVTAQAAYTRGATVSMRDLTNAFNTTRIRDVVAILRKDGYSLAADILSSLGQHQIVHVEGVITAGHIPQGSSFGSTSMAIKVDDAIREVRRTAEGACCMSYADDVAVVAKTETKAEETVEAATKELEKVGLSANRAKTTVLNQGNGATGKILGVHVGPQAEERVYSEFGKLAAKVDHVMGVVCSNSLSTDHVTIQTAYRWLAYNVVSAANHMLQHQIIQETARGAALLDGAIARAMARMLRLSAEEQAQIEPQLRLPVKAGGLGLPSLEESAKFFRLGALARSVGDVGVNLRNVYGQDMSYPIFPELPGLVAEIKQMSEMHDQDKLNEDLVLLRAINEGNLQVNPTLRKRMSTLGNRLRQRFQAHKAQQWVQSFRGKSLDIQERVFSISQPQAGRFLSAAPTYYFNRIPDAYFVNACKRRLLLRIVPLGTPACAQEGGSIDDMGEHFLKCRKLGRGCGHHDVKRAIQRSWGPIAKRTGARVVAEPSMDRYKRVGRAHDDIKTRGDLAFFDMRERSSVIADVITATIKTPKANNDIGQTVCIAEKEKNDLYDAAYTFPTGVTFLPIAIDSYGHLGPQFSVRLQKDCRRAAGGNFKIYNQLISNARTQISVAHMLAIGRRIHDGIHRGGCITSVGAREAFATRVY